MPANSKVTDGALYVATDTGTMWLGVSATKLLQIKDNIDTNTTYTLVKSGSSIQLKNQAGTVISTVTDSNTTYSAATQSAAGLMSAADKAKLDGVATGANNITVDSALSSTSTNPVQNKVVNSALAGKASSSHNHDSVYVKKAGDTVTGQLKVNGTAASQPLIVRGIVGSDGSGVVSELHLQYGANAPINLGNAAAYSISADGGTYTGKAATAGVADSAKAVAWGNVTGKPSTFAPSSHTHTSLVAQSTMVSNSTDWTSITAPGIYSVGISDFTNAKNYPSGMYGYGDLYVQEVNGHITQIYWSHQGDCFERQAWDKTSAGVWSYGSWYKVYTSKNRPAWGDVTGKPNFATVATSGSYNDLSNKPTIPTTLKNPNALTISLNGSSQGAYDGSTAKTINVTAASTGAVPDTAAGLSAAINKLDSGTATPADADYYVSQYVGGGTTTTSYHRRPMSSLWAYIKGKTDNLYQAKGSYAAASHNHSAANITSGTLDIARIPDVSSKVSVVDVAKLSGTISAANLPSYVDDVLEYDSLSKFPATGETGKIYTATDTNKIYRWSGSAYVVISDTLALGTTHASAGYGDESRAAYNHSNVKSGNPHGVTKSDVGLGNVENKSSATIRGELTKANVTTALGYTPPTTNTTYGTMGAATASAAGTSGLVPAPAAGKQTSFLRGDGTWVVPTNTTYGVVTASANGLMSAADKSKLDGIAAGANKYTYTLPTATSSVLGGVKTGSNITNSSGTISITKANVVAALGYTPPTTNTTYAALTDTEIDAAWSAVFG